MQRPVGASLWHEVSMVRWAVLLLLFAHGLRAQSIQDNFVLDKSKPFAYLTFDHIGPRKPLQNGEGTEGLWLRLVNNCRIPILLRAQAKDEEPILEHEVLLEEPMLQIVNGKEIKGLKREQRDRNEALKHKPDGYEFEVSGVILVQPGEGALFGVPLNHVGHFWFMRVEFAFDLDESSTAAGPFVYLDFHEYDLPKARVAKH